MPTGDSLHNCYIAHPPEYYIAQGSLEIKQGEGT